MNQMLAQHEERCLVFNSAPPARPPLTSLKPGSKWEKSTVERVLLAVSSALCATARSNGGGRQGVSGTTACGAFHLTRRLLSTTTTATGLVNGAARLENPKVNPITVSTRTPAMAAEDLRAS
eukprot:1213465-Pleurochrysis_carterae.AAC.1